MWYKAADAKPAKAGTYLILDGPDSEGAACPDTCDYFHKGDPLIYLPPDGETAEKRLLQALFDERYTVKAPYDGFFETDGEEKYWEVRPTWWAPMPEPPEGLHYYNQEE